MAKKMKNKVYLEGARSATGETVLLFYEYSHGDNGAGLGASHQTGSGIPAPTRFRTAVR
jgi:hypothetical protein